MLVDYLMDLAASGYIVTMRDSSIIGGVVIRMTKKGHEDIENISIITTLEVETANKEFTFYKRIEKIRLDLEKMIEDNK